MKPTIRYLLSNYNYVKSLLHLMASNGGNGFKQPQHSSNQSGWRTLWRRLEQKRKQIPAIVIRNNVRFIARCFRNVVGTQRGRVTSRRPPRPLAEPAAIKSPTALPATPKRGDGGRGTGGGLERRPRNCHLLKLFLNPRTTPATSLP